MAPIQFQYVVASVAELRHVPIANNVIETDDIVACVPDYREVLTHSNTI